MRQIGPGLPGGEEPESEEVSASRQNPVSHEEEVRRVLAGARASGGAGAAWYWLAVFVLPLGVRGALALPPAVVWFGILLVLGLVGAGIWRRSRTPVVGPLRRAAIEHVSGAEVVVRLDDGSLWGFVAAPQFDGRLHVGDELTLPEPREGRVVAARYDASRGEYDGIVGRDCTLYRPAPTTYVVPGLDAAPAATLTRAQAGAYLAYRMSLLRGPVKMSPRRRAVVADVGTDPDVELVEVDAVWAHRVRVRRGDGSLFGWPMQTGIVLLAPGARVWATRMAEGLYVVLVALSDEGRRVRVVWPQGRAVAEEPEAPGAPDPPVDAVR